MISLEEVLVFTEPLKRPNTQLQPSKRSEKQDDSNLLIRDTICEEKDDDLNWFIWDILCEAADHLFSFYLYFAADEKPSKTFLFCVHFFLFNWVLVGNSVILKINEFITICHLCIHRCAADCKKSAADNFCFNF